jgi:hypothetical protein
MAVNNARIEGPLGDFTELGLRLRDLLGMDARAYVGGGRSTTR